MEEFSRSELKNDPKLRALFDLVKSNHKVANHTIEVLRKNRDVKDFCEEASHFVQLDGGKDSIYFHYDVSSWYHSKNGALIKIERLVVYEDFKEYESARLKGIHSTVHSDGVNLN